MIKNIIIDFPIIEVRDLGRRPSSATDVSALIHLIEEYSTNDILEIGTWYGKTTYELASAFPNKIVYTIDYMEDDLILSEHGTKTRAKKEDLCKYAKDLDNVVFIYENSHTYDFYQLGYIDFIFIDGNHSFDGVKKDSEKSIDYLRGNNGGIIAWHDIHNKGLTDVPRYLNCLAKEIDINYIKGTNIGFTIV